MKQDHGWSAYKRIEEMMTKMRRLTALLLVLSMASCLWAGVILGTGNDTFSYGLSDDRDDGLTYSLFASYEGEVEENLRYQLGAEYLAYTTRDLMVHKELGGTEVLRGRIDELRLVGGVERVENLSSLELGMKALIGASFYGNLGGEFCQNLLHDTLGIKEVVLPYETLSPSFSMMMGFSARNMEWSSPFAETWCGYEGFIKTGGKVGWSLGGDKCKFDAFVGAEANFSLDCLPFRTATEQCTGVMSGFNLDTGALILGYKRYHPLNTGYGTVSLRLPVESTYEESDAVFSYGGMMVGNKRVNTIVARKELGDNIHVVFMDNFFSETYQRTPVQGISSISDLEVGFRCGGRFYAQTTMGVGRIRCEDHATHYKVENPVVDEAFYMTSTLEFGASLDTPIVLGGTKLGMEAFCGLHGTGGASHASAHVEFDKYGISDIMVVYGVRCNFNLDF